MPWRASGAPGKQSPAKERACRQEEDGFQFAAMNLHALVSPFFLTRFRLRRAIRETATLAQPTGRLIDVGCGQMPHRDLFPGIGEYQGIDFAGFSVNKDFQTGRPDFEFPPDYTTHWRLPFADGSYDHAAAFEVVEHHPEPVLLLRELARVVRPGGYVFLSWPHIFPLHEEPHDYFRYTHYAMERMASAAGLESVRFVRTGGLLAVLVTLLTANLAQFHERGGWRGAAGVLAYPPLLLLQYLCVPFAGCVNRTTVLSYVALLRRTKA
jgi:SAM-dependent methyltransferase